MTNVDGVEKEDAIVGSMAEIEAADAVEYATIKGFKPGQMVDIGSLSAGDLIEWTEANEGPAKRTAGLRLIAKSLVSSEKEGRVRYANDDKYIAVFRRKTHKVTEAVVKEILKLNGMEIKQEKEVGKD